MSVTKVYKTITLPDDLPLPAVRESIAETIVRYQLQAAFAGTSEGWNAWMAKANELRVLLVALELAQ